MSFETYRLLLETVQDACLGYYDPRRFNQVLEEHITVLRNPGEKGPNQESDTKLRAKKVVLQNGDKLGDEMIRKAIEFSRRLRLDQVLAAKLVYAADVAAPKIQGNEVTPGRNLLDNAKRILRKRRDRIMVALLDLMGLYNDAIDPLSKHVRTFVQRLLVREDSKSAAKSTAQRTSKGLVENLISMIRNLHQRPAEQRDQVGIEIWRALQVLFRLFRHPEGIITTPQVTAILEFLKELKGSGELERRTRIMLLLTISAGLNRRCAIQFEPKEEGVFIKCIYEQRMGWDNSVESEPYRYAFGLIYWAYCKTKALKYPRLDETKFQTVRANNTPANAFDKLRNDLLESKWFKQLRDYIKTDIAASTCEMLHTIISNHLTFLRQKADFDDRGQSMGEIVKFLAAVCEISPSCVQILEDTETGDASNFQTFLSELRKDKEHYQSELQIPYLELLASLCRSEVGWNVVLRMLAGPQEPDKQDRNQRATELIKHYCYKSMRRNIKSPERYAILKLIQSLAVNTELDAKDNSKDSPLNTMFQLLALARSQRLKSYVVDTLRAFGEGKNKEEFMTAIWKRIERSEIVPRRRTNPLDMFSKAIQRLVGIVADLEEVEHREEKYDTTIAFGRLVHAVIEVCPQLIYSVPLFDNFGLGPYLQFLVCNVLVRVLGRRTKPGSEHHRWQMAEAPLAICCKILHDYKPQQGRTRYRPDATSHPGHYMMLSLGGGGALFDTLVKLISRAYTDIEKEIQEISELGDVAESTSENRKHIERVLMLALKVFDIALEKEEGFLKLVNTPSSGMKAEYVSLRLLQSETARNHNIVVRISKCVGLNLDDEEICYHAAKIIRLLGLRDERVVANIAVRPVDAKMDVEDEDSAQPALVELCAAFAKRFEAATQAQGDVPGQNGKQWGTMCKIVLVQALLDNLKLLRGDAQLSCMLLGLGMPDEASTQFLDEIMTLVEKPKFASGTPTLAEGCFELFYHLYSHPRTSQAFSKYLQRKNTTGEFGIGDASGAPTLFKLLKSLQEIPEQHTATTLLQRAWLLKCIALDVYINSTRERDDSIWSDNVRDTLYRLGFWHSDRKAGPSSSNFEQKQIQMLELLHGLDVTIEQPRTDAIARYQSKRLRPGGVYDLASLAAVVAETQNQSSAREIVTQAKKWNEYVFKVKACEQAVDGWRQLAEVALHEGSKSKQSQADASKYDSVLHNLLSGVLQKLCSHDFIWQTLLSEVALTIMAKIRLRQKQNKSGISLLASSPNVLHEIVQALCQSRNYRTRANLYAVFSNYMQYAKQLNNGQNESKNVSYNETSLMVSSNAHLLRRYGIKLLDRACHDAKNGDNCTMAMATVFISTLLDYELSEYSKTRFRVMPNTILRRLCDKENIHQFASEMLNPRRTALLKTAIFSEEHTQQIYIYEMLASLLTKIALQPEGAEHLTRYKVVGLLAECSFLDSYPEPRTSFEPQYLPTKSQRYYQILIPSLQLISCMLTTHPKNVQLKPQAMDFFIQHRDVVHKIFDDCVRRIRHDVAENPYVPLTSALHAAKLMTGILAILYSESSYHTAGKTRNPFLDMLLQKMKRILAGLQKIVTSNRYYDPATDGLVPNQLLDPNEPDDNTMIFEIIRNVLSICSFNCLYFGDKKILQREEEEGFSFMTLMNIFRQALDMYGSPQTANYNERYVFRRKHRVHIATQIIENVLHILHFDLKSKDAREDIRLSVRSGEGKQLLGQLEVQLEQKLRNEVAASHTTQFMRTMIRKIKALALGAMMNNENSRANW